MPILRRIQSAWNAFFNKDPTDYWNYDAGPVTNYRPDRIRQIVGMKPSDDPKADELINSNLSQAKQDMRSREPTNVPEGGDGS